MTNAWRAAGITYIKYSNICAKIVREALKTDARAEAAKRNASHVKFTPWKDGRPAHEKP
ncbi:protein stunted isoform X2 [Condylostylus longicornis]|uniref:protein stunted isoform X2 n=1 Tax=Condylostylus longicornis TaxID=2530218 RepID=UPI00244E1431|nr:protein stunted isoform X2 [Condylostylus longicornis]